MVKSGFSIHELLPGPDIHLGGVSDVDASRDLVYSCSDNCQEIISRFSGFGQAVCNHFLLGDISELGDGLVVNDGLLDADNVSKEPLILTGFQVMDTAE